MKRSKGIQGRMIFLIFMVLLALGLVIPSAVSAESENNTDQGIIAQSGDQAIQPLADVDCYAGQSYTLSGSIYTFDGSREIKFYSSDTSILKITNQKTSGVIINSTGNFNYVVEFEALKSGEATIQGISDTGSVKLTKKITILKPDPTSVSLSDSTFAVDVGETAQASATVLPTQADQKVTWSIQDEEIATIDEDGKITGIKNGSTKITATTVNGLTNSATVNVYDPVQSLTLDRDQLELTKGSPDDLNVSILPETANPNVIWTSSDSKIVKVEGGSLYGVSVGTATITATSADGKKSASCQVTVTYAEATSIRIECLYNVILKGESETAAAIVEPDSADPTVTWETSDPSIASVIDGKVTGISPGMATITAKTANGMTDSFTITVILPEPSSVSLDQTEVSLEKGKNVTLTASVSPSDASQDVTWSSSNTDVATVSNGKITAVSTGSAIITAKTSNGKTASCTVTVPAPDATSISLNLTSISLEVGKTSTLSSKVNPSEASQDVTWSSSDESIVTVLNGTITAVSKGTATITVKTNNGKAATCKVTVTDSASDAKPIYRLYMPSTGEHLYTSDKHEYDTLYQKYGWGQEGIGWYAPSSGTAVYRLYQPGLKNHLYTTDKNEVKVLTSKYGWVTDNGGEALYYSGGSVPIYRVYNKGLNGMHHLTTDTNEYNTLPKFGWQQEGATLYATKLGSPYATTKFYK